MLCEHCTTHWNCWFEQVLSYGWSTLKEICGLCPMLSRFTHWKMNIPRIKLLEDDTLKLASMRFLRGVWYTLKYWGYSGYRILIHIESRKSMLGLRFVPHWNITPRMVSLTPTTLKSRNRWSREYVARHIEMSNGDWGRNYGSHHIEIFQMVKKVELLPHWNDGNRRMAAC